MLDEKKTLCESEQLFKAICDGADRMSNETHDALYKLIGNPDNKKKKTAP